MKKQLLFALLFSVSAVAVTNAFFGRSCHRGCQPTYEQPAACFESVTSCEQPATPPVCTKTVKVPKTILVDKVVQVPARRIEMPQPDIIERIPQAPRKICIKQPPIPQPDIIKYEPVPDRIVCRKQPNLVRYECPVGTQEGNGCNTCN